MKLFMNGTSISVINIISLEGKKMDSIRYFKDNFFSAGLTEIYTEDKEIVGTLDLKSAFSSSLDVLNAKDEIVVQGRFPFFSNRWIIEDHTGTELGVLRGRFSFFTKRFEYTSHEYGVYRIESPTFSRHYEIYNGDGEKEAEFDRINGFFQSPAFRLQNRSPFSDGEMTAVVMGVYMIQKRNDSAATIAPNT